MNDSASLVWEIRIGEHAVEVRDLPLQEIARIARVTQVSWAIVVGMPYADLTVASMLIETAARILGIDAPQSDSLTPRTILEYFVDVSEADQD